jgi:hypothetical protein
LQIEGNPALVNLGDFPNLVEAGGVLIQENSALLDISEFTALAELLSLHIRDNAALTSISGFAEMSSDDFLLNISSNPKLAQITGFGALRGGAEAGIWLVSNESLNDVSGFRNIAQLWRVLRWSAHRRHWPGGSERFPEPRPDRR